MPRLVLRPACPVCGQTLRANDWIYTVGLRPVAIAHEIFFARQSIARRELAIGEHCSPEAEVVIDVDSKNKPIFAPAEERQAPDGWLKQLKFAMDRAQESLAGIDENDRHDGIESAKTKNDFDQVAASYIAEAERAVENAKRELDYRTKEVAAAARRFDE